MLKINIEMRGPQASGKTTLARKLKEFLKENMPEGAVVVCTSSLSQNGGRPEIEFSLGVEPEGREKYRV